MLKPGPLIILGEKSDFLLLNVNQEGDSFLLSACGLKYNDLIISSCPFAFFILTPS